MRKTSLYTLATLLAAGLTIGCSLSRGGADKGKVLGTTDQPYVGSTPKANQGWTSVLTDNPVSRGVSSGWKKTVAAVTPKSSPEGASDPISLAHRSDPPKANLYVSMAQMKEKTGEIP